MHLVKLVYDELFLFNEEHDLDLPVTAVSGSPLLLWFLR